jgi:histidine kinase
LLLEDEKTHQMRIQAEFATGKEMQVLNSVTLEQSTQLCAAIVSYVARTQEDIVLNDASQDAMFASDPYISRHQIKSLLCTPIRHKGKVSAILYLENNLSTNVFTPERLLLLSLVSSQAAISIDNAKLYKLATTDRMTGLYNNTHFQNSLEQGLTQAASSKTPMALLLFDVDHFKKFNDSYGHQAGDEVLKAVARTVRASVRKNDLCARYGGEEFAVILPDTSLSTAKDMAETLRQNIANLVIDYNDLQLTVKVSIGVAYVPFDNSYLVNKDQMIKAADMALYKSKERGRNCVSVADAIR